MAGDIYRPAAIKQLQVLGEQIERAGVLRSATRRVRSTSPSKALQHAKEQDHDYVIIDTAGRLHIDEELMDGAASKFATR